MNQETFPNLRSYVDRLKRDRDLAIVEARVTARLEVAEIHRRVIAAGGPALLFTNVEGADFPLVTNLFGTRGRAEAAFGDRPFQLIKRLVETAQTALPPNMGTLWSARDLIVDLMKIGTKKTRHGPVAENISSTPDLGKLPVLTSWPDDGGPFITLPLVHTRHPEGIGDNLGMYRLQVHDRQTTGMHWQIGKGGGFHYDLAEKLGQSLPATVYLGGPPALTLAAIAPLPENVPELLLASLIAGGRLPVCQGPQGQSLLAETEFALVGRVPAGKRAPEGPFGDHYGYYSLQHDYPVFEVGWMGHRDKALYPATVVGKPRQEDFFIGDLLQELLAPLFPLVMPGVEDLWSYGETGYHSLAAAVVKERYRRESMASAFRILGEGQLSLTKFLLVIDQQIDLKDFKATLQHLLERTRPETDLFVFSNLSMDTLDYTGPKVNEGSKGVWLGLGDPIRDLPAEFQATTLPAGVSEVEVYCPGCLVVGADSFERDRGLAGRVASTESFAEWPLIIVTDEPRRAVASDVNFLWTTFTRFEPAADIYSAQTEVVRNHLSYRLPVVIDARVKPNLPAELFCSPEIATRVTDRWMEYFPDGMEMGDSSLGHLDPAK